MANQRSTRTTPTNPTTKRSPKFPVKAIAVTSIVAVALGAAVAIGVTAPVADDPRTAGVSSDPSGGQPEFTVARRLEGDVTAIGALDAPVVLVEYADYRCPFCGVFARTTLPPLITEYVDEGLLRIEWRDMPVFGEQSVDAAVAARAAGEQGKFWEYHEILFADAPERGHADFPRDVLIAAAATAEVPDIERFTADLDNAELLARVARDRDEATALGVTGTPTFLVGNTPISGAQPIAVFREAIDAELNRAEQGQ